MSVKFAGALALAVALALGVAGTGAAGDAGGLRKSAVARAGNLPSSAMTMAAAHNVEGGRARPPMGWIDFCKRYPDQCERSDFVAAPIVFQGAVKNLILQVNHAVNGAIRPATDLAQWGGEERWDFAESGIGDCEDYVLLKQRWLVSAGLPRHALLVTVVTDLAGDGHAVLTVHTDRGDFILDNMTDDVKLWRETPYGFVKRQSRFVSNDWVSLDGGGAAPVIVSR